MKKQTHEFYTHITDIWYYDGPLLSYCKDLDGEDMLMYWVDKSDNTNTWLCSTIGDELYSKFVNKQIDLRECILGARVNMLIELDNQINVVSDTVINILDYPNYLCEEGVFCDLD